MIGSFILGGITAASFSMLYNNDKSTLLPTFIEGFIAWAVFIYAKGIFNTEVLPSLIGSFCMSVAGEFMARRLKKPSTVFLIPGLIPLVPGAKLYHAMYNLVLNENLQAYNYARDTILIAGAIALGVLFASAFSKSIINTKKRKSENKEIYLNN